MSRRLSRDVARQITTNIATLPALLLAGPRSAPHDSERTGRLRSGRGVDANDLTRGETKCLDQRIAHRLGRSRREDRPPFVGLGVFLRLDLDSNM